MLYPLAFFSHVHIKKGACWLRLNRSRFLPPLPQKAGDFIFMKSIKNNDNEKLLRLQEEYLKTKSQESWNELFLLSLSVCRKIVVSEFIKNKIMFTQEDLYNYAVDACIYVLRRYRSQCYTKQKLAVKNYYVKKNFISALKYGVRHALYYTTLEKKNFNRALSFETVSYKVPFCEDDKRL